MASQFTRRLAEARPGFDFVGAHFACERNRYSPENPNGYVNFGSAQNFLNPAELEARLAPSRYAADDAHYQPFPGTLACREAVAGHLAALAGAPVDAADIVLGNGVISLLEALGIALLDAGDAVLVPTPVFPGLVAALRLRIASGVALAPLDAAKDFLLGVGDLEAALDREEAAGRRVKAVLLCSPGNPVGQVFGADELNAIVGFAEERGVALIVDEVYAGSCFEGVAFHSVLANGSPSVFVMGGLSKDFGLAGYATGWLHGRDEAVMAAVAKQSHFFRLPAPVQRSMEAVLEPSWRDPFLETNRRRLTESAAAARHALDAMGVACSPTDAGLCLWTDLRDRLDTPDQAGELRLYRRLLEEHRVHISPGSGFHFPTPGYFRLCFSQARDTLDEGLRRLGEGLRQLGQDPRRPSQELESGAPQPVPPTSRTPEVT